MIKGEIRRRSKNETTPLTVPSPQPRTADVTAAATTIRSTFIIISILLSAALLALLVLTGFIVFRRCNGGSSGGGAGNELEEGEEGIEMKELGSCKNLCSGGDVSVGGDGHEGIFSGAI